MGFLADGLALVRSPNRDRLPMAPRTGSTSLSLSGLMGQQSQLSALNAMTASGWLFAVVDRIASAVAAADWLLEEGGTGGERREVAEHPALDLWAQVNPWMTRHEYLEIIGQHFELVGEMWTIIVRNVLGQPVELWPVRPDRMRVVPDPDGYILGYLYRVGSETVPLETDDVIFIRRPSPIDPYRGIGVVQSILIDLGAEQEAARYARAFYANSAEPGGIIELDHELDDIAFQRITQRWREQHQGTGNAHRVAILERGKWVDRKYTMRDMQAEALRHLNRDIILGAFGIHKSVMGITEDVNRSNAEAGEVHFGRWIIRPRLERIRQALNERLLPQYGTARKLEFVYKNPVPDDRIMDLAEATQGYACQLLTRNEARLMLDKPAVPGGDDFYEPPAFTGFGGDPDAKFVNGRIVRRALSLPDPTTTSLAELQRRGEEESRAAWEKRLNEVEADFLKFIEANWPE